MPRNPPDLVRPIDITQEEAEGFMEALTAARVELAATQRKANRSRPTTVEGHNRKTAIAQNAELQRERIERLQERIGTAFNLGGY